MNNGDFNITAIVVNWYSSTFLKVLFANLRDKAGAPEKIRFLIVDNTNGLDNSLAELSSSGSSVTIMPNKPASQHGSRAHASGLNLALRAVKTEYGLILDPDTHIFKGDWDDFCVDLLRRNDVIAVGATFPPWQLGKYHNFPNPVFCFFDTAEFLEMPADWTPYELSPIMKCLHFVKRNIVRCGKLIDRKKYGSSGVARTVGMRLERIMGVCSADTGYLNALRAEKQNVGSITFRAALPDDHAAFADTAAFKDLASHYELYYYRDEPILTHKYNTAGKHWRTKKGDDVSFWREAIARFEKAVDDRRQLSASSVNSGQT